MTAQEILRIKHPEWIFPQDLDAMKQKHRDLAKQWHPDVCKDKDAENVFQHVSHLYEEALKRLDEGHWGFSGILRLRAKSSSREWELRYHKKRTFELGEYYAGDTVVAYVLDEKHENLFYSGAKAIEALKYPSKKVEEECKRYLPHDCTQIPLDDGRFALVIEKTPDLLCLKDVVDHHGGNLHPTQAAWILSTLLNLSCYLWVSHLTHNDISLETYFISPEHHSGALLGGWWYANPRGHTVTQIPARTFNYLPWKVKSTKKASRLTDQELIKLVGREMLGSEFSKSPEALQEWLREVSNESAVEAYDRWINEVLPKSFGKRRFVKMDVNADKLYR